MAHRFRVISPCSPHILFAISSLLATSILADCSIEGGCAEPVGSTAERAMQGAKAAQEKALQDAEAWVVWVNNMRDLLVIPVMRLFKGADSQTLWITGLVVVIGSAVSSLLLYSSPDNKLKSPPSMRGPLNSNANNAERKHDAASTDPGLLKKHSEQVSYTITVSGRSITFPSIRTFFHPHPQATKLPTSPTTIPLLVFVHGLGGSVAQFAPLLTSLVNVAPCLAIDLPGCGMSAFHPKDWDAYKLEAMAELVGAAIEQYRDKELGQEVVLVGHSLGCSLSLLLASSTSPLLGAKRLAKHVRGLIAICPRAEPPTEKQVATFKKLLCIPGPIFDLWRTWDKRGGTESASVARFVGPSAEEETKRAQVRFNAQSKTAVWRRMASGTLPDYTKSQKGGMPGQDIWQGLRVPTMLIAGEADKVTPATELEKIASFLGKTSNKEASEESHESEAVTDAAAPVDTGAQQQVPDGRSTKPQLNEDRPKVHADIPVHPTALKTTILPSPAAHALLYSASTVRIIAGLIQAFLADHIDPHLSLGWQLQYLTTEGKWDVKNLAKWQKVTCVSGPIPSPLPFIDKRYEFKDPFHDTSIARDLPSTSPSKPQRTPVFRAMKTLREVDEVHSPTVFVQHWRGKIAAVVDISHESPVYNPAGLENGGIQYHKFPTVSKLPPTADEVCAFIALIDRLRDELHIGTAPLDGNEKVAERELDPPVIGVHCHYGFNRTGFFLVSYMVERLGFRLQDAIDEFERMRPPGIRHGHFVDALFVRYCFGLRRAPTL